jgi:hypothetical protein
LIRAALILGLAALVLMAPALIHGAPTTDSGAYNQVWVSQIASEMARGVLYPRWLPQSFEGLGAPTFYFYPPLAYLLAGALALFLDVGRAIGAAALLLLFASGLTMYLWLRGKASETVAIAGALLYLAAPYHLTDFYVRSALAEFGALAWLPLIALAIERQPARWAGPLLAVSYAGLVVTHLPMALLATAILIPPLVWWRARREPVVALRCAVAGLAGVALAGLYLLPALTLQDHTLIEQVMWSAAYDPDRRTIWAFLRGEGPKGMRLMMPLALEWTLVAAIALIGVRQRFWALMTLWAVACATGLIPLVSLPVLEKAQFPWRALGIVEFLAVTAAVAALPRRVPMITAGFIALQSLLIVGQALVGPERPVNPEIVARRIDALEYLPADLSPVPTSRPRPDLTAVAGPLVRGPVATTAIGEDGSIELRAKADGEVIVRRGAFPRWRVTADGREVALESGPLVRFKVQAGRSYRLEAVRTRPEVLGGWLSLAGLALVLLLWLPFPRLRRPEVA